jgi:DNA-directed RNA polymerase specialized sigma24 family protein
MSAGRVVEVTKTYRVTARRWAQGWELHVADVGVTQCQPLADADRMARDYLATELGGEPEDYAVEIRPDLGGIEVEAATVRQRMLEAQAAVDAAADDMRQVVRRLRGDGLSVRDTATILEVSPGRVSQLANDHPKTRKAVPRVKAPRQVA